MIRKGDKIETASGAAELLSKGKASFTNTLLIELCCDRKYLVISTVLSVKTMENDKTSEDVPMRTGRRVAGNSAFRNTLAASLARYGITIKHQFQLCPNKDRLRFNS